MLERLSYLFGIYGALQILLPVPERANEWTGKPNTAPILAGSSALDCMMGGQVPSIVDPDRYAAAKGLGRALRASGSQGIGYDSVRRPQGQRAAVFKPRALSNARAVGYLGLHWNGQAISHWFEKGLPRQLSRSALPLKR